LTGRQSPAFPICFASNWLQNVSLRHHFEPENNVRLARLCGPLDAHLRRIEDALGVSINRRGAQFTIDGPGDAPERALNLLKELHAKTERPLYEQALELAVAEAVAAAGPSPEASATRVLPATSRAAGAAEASTGAAAPPVAASRATAMAQAPGAMDTRPSAPRAAASPLTVVADVTDAGKKSERAPAKARAAASSVTPEPAPGIRSEPKSSPARRPASKAACTEDPAQRPPEEVASPVLHTRRSDLRGRTANQVRYLGQMLAHDVTFGIGPAGTGKTFLAVACAVDALERHSVQRVVLTRPAVEAGERLGFLPGDLAQKVDPYLRPLYDALYDLMGFDRVAKAFEKGLIEIAPLAFMRGRTLNHAFVILDEAQNTTREQMMMFLTRLGFGSRCVVTGDVSQIDLPAGVPSGLVDAEQVLAAVEGIAFTRFTPADVVRHPLVARIVEAYDAARDRR
jgi:phosphate starvation-inducible PhoH-like protein